MLSFYNRVESWYTEKKNNFYLSIGGNNKTFVLETKEVTFAILNPSKYNIAYRIFQHFKTCKAFQKCFKLILCIPYFFTETFTGNLILFLIIFWASVGRELYTVLFCAFFVWEYIFLLFYLDYFLRLGTNYQDCIDIYGKSFIEKYIDNPITARQIKNMPKIIGFAMSAVALDQTDRSLCSFRCSTEIQERLQDYRKDNIKITAELIEKVHTEARTNNIPRLNSFSETVTKLFKKGR